MRGPARRAPATSLSVVRSGHSPIREGARRGTGDSCKLTEERWLGRFGRAAKVDPCRGRLLIGQWQVRGRGVFRTAKRRSRWFVSAAAAVAVTVGAALMTPVPEASATHPGPRGAAADAESEEEVRTDPVVASYAPASVSIPPVTHGEVPVETLEAPSDSIPTTDPSTTAMLDDIEPITAQSVETRVGDPNLIEAVRSGRYNELRPLPGREPVEIVDLRTAESRTLITDDGTFMTEFGAGPMHVEDSAGAWHPIDTSLQRRPDGQFTAARTPMAVEIGSAADELVALRTRSGEEVSFLLVGARDVRPVVDGNVASYRNVQEGVDLNVEVTPAGVKEEIILAGPDSTRTIRFALHLDGLSPQLTEGGDVELVDGSGQVKLVIPKGWMVDSSRHPETGGLNESMGVHYDLTEENGRFYLSISLEHEWLDDPARVWPVVVDPTVQDFGAMTDDTHVNSCYTNNYSTLGVFKVGGSDCQRAGYARWNLDLIPGAKIFEANIATWNSYSYSCSPRNVSVYRVTQAWSGSTMRNWPGANFNATPIASRNFALGYNAGCPAGWVTFPVTGLVQSWVSGVHPNHGVTYRVNASTTSDMLTYKELATVEAYGLHVLQVRWSPYVPQWQIGQLTQSVYANQSGYVPITLTNAGPALWTATGANPYRIGYHVYDASGQLVLWDGARTVLPADMPFASQRTVSARIAPLAPGTYTVHWDMVREGVLWFSQHWDNPSTTSGPLAAMALTVPNRPPAAGTVSPADEAVVHTASPTLELGGIHDPDLWPTGAGLQGRFQICPTPQQTSECVTSPWSTATSGSVTWTPELAQGSSHWRYQLREHHVSGQSTPWSSWRQLRIASPYISRWQFATSLSTDVYANQAGRIELTVTNDGTEPWLAGGSAADSVGYHVYDSDGALIDWDGELTSLLGDVQPGSSATLEADIAALPPGAYVLKWDMYRSGPGGFWHSSTWDDPEVPGGPLGALNLVVPNLAPVAGSATPGEGSTMGSRSPTLVLEGITNPDAWPASPVQVQFEICPTSESTAECATSPWIDEADGAVEWRAPFLGGSWQGAHWRYQLREDHDHGASSGWASWRRIGLPEMPETACALSASAGSDVAFSWESWDEPVTRVVERSIDGGVWIQRAELSNGESSFTEPAATGTTVEYRLTTRSTTGQLITVDLCTPTLPPVGAFCFFLPSPVDGWEYSVHWTPVPGASAYQVVDRHDGAGPWNPVTSAPSSRLVETVVLDPQAEPAIGAAFQVGVTAVVGGHPISADCLRFESFNDLPGPSWEAPRGQISPVAALPPMSPSSQGGELPLGTVDFQDNACAQLQSGIPIALPGTTLAGEASYQNDTLVSYIWVPDGYYAHASGSLIPMDATLTPNNLGIFRFAPWIDLSWQHKDSLHGVTYDSTSNSSYSSHFISGPTAVVVPGGRFILTGVHMRWAFAAVVESTWSQTVHEPVPIDPANPPPPTGPPCVAFHDMLLRKADIDYGVLFGDNVPSLSDTLLDLGGVLVQFIPGYDCVDAIVNGVNGWNAAGCIADLAALGVSLTALRNAGDFSIVARQGDDLVGAMDNIPASQFADDLESAINSRLPTEWLSCIVPGGWNSFAGDTPVLLADGSSKPIELVQAGDWVLGRDESLEVAASVVTDVWEHEDSLVDAHFASGVVSTTPDHRFWNGTDREWQELDDFEVGDAALGSDGREIAFQRFDEAAEEDSAFNLTVAGLHTYYVEVGSAFLLVHNSNCQPSLLLRNNMIADGSPRVRTFVDELGNPVPDEAHHILPTRTQNWYPELHGILDDLGFNYNSSRNGTILPRTRPPGYDGQVHWGSHTHVAPTSYVGAINDDLLNIAARHTGSPPNNLTELRRRLNQMGQADQEVLLEAIYTRLEEIGWLLQNTRDFAALNVRAYR